MRSVDPDARDVDPDEVSGRPPGGVAMVLTGDRAAAAALLAAARRRSRGVEPSTRSLVAEAGRRRRPEVVAEPDREPLRGDLELVARALDRLTPLQRSGLVATRLGELTIAETAALLDRPAAQLSRAVAEAMTTLGDPYAVQAALEQLAWQEPTSAESAAAGLMTDRQFRRRRRVIAAGIGAAILALFAPVAVPLFGPAPPAYARTAGQWTYGLALEAPGWTVASHRLSQDEELIVATRDGSTATCQLSAQLGAPLPDGDVNPLRRVRINGRLGTYARTGGEQRLSWKMGVTATASAVCSGTPDDRGTALDLARALRLQAGLIRLPFRLAGLPLGTRLGWVGERAGRTQVSIVSTTGMNIDSEAATISVYQVSYGTALDHDPESSWSFADRVDGPSACRTVEHLQFCVDDPRRETSGPSRGSAARFGRLLMVVEAIDIIPAAADRAGWLDANDALPR